MAYPGASPGIFDRVFPAVGKLNGDDWAVDKFRSDSLLGLKTLRPFARGVSGSVQFGSVKSVTIPLCPVSPYALYSSPSSRPSC